MERTAANTRIDDLPYRPCVGLMILNDRGHVFVGQRLDSTGEAWQMPQGGIDPGETPRQAALRELVEETGIRPGQVEVLRESARWHPYELPRHLVGRLWGGRYRGQTQRWFALRFIGSDDEIDIEGEVPEFGHWTWIPPEQLVDRIVHFKRDTYAAVLEEFRDLL